MTRKLLRFGIDVIDITLRGRNELLNYVLLPKLNKGYLKLSVKLWGSGSVCDVTCRPVSNICCQVWERRFENYVTENNGKEYVTMDKIKRISVEYLPTFLQPTACRDRLSFIFVESACTYRKGCYFPNAFHVFVALVGC